MKKALLILVFFWVQFMCYSQNSDLIVTTDGDSIACKIIKVNEVDILIKMNHDNRPLKKTIPVEEIKQLEYNVVKPGMYRFEDGSSRIVGIIDISPQKKYYPLSSRSYSFESLKKATGEDIDYLNGKAIKLQKTGKTMIYIGVGAAMFGGILYIDGASKEGWDGLGEAVLGVGTMLSGLATTGLGIIIKRNGTRRVEQIGTFKQNQNQDVVLEMMPAIGLHSISNDFYPSFCLCLRF